MQASFGGVKLKPNVGQVLNVLLCPGIRTRNSWLPPSHSLAWESKEYAGDFSVIFLVMLSVADNEKHPLHMS